MAGSWETPAAATVVTLGGYELWKSWTDSAPSLAELRGAKLTDAAEFARIHQQLVDAEFTVGSLAIIVGGSMWVLTGKPTVLVMLGVTVSALAYWYNGLLQDN